MDQKKRIEEECANLGIFPHYTEGCLCMELNKLKNHIDYQDKFGKINQIKEENKHLWSDVEIKQKTRENYVSRVVNDVMNLIRHKLT